MGFTELLPGPNLKGFSFMPSDRRQLSPRTAGADLPGVKRICMRMAVPPVTGGGQILVIACSHPGLMVKMASSLLHRRLRPHLGQTRSWGQPSGRRIHRTSSSWATNGMRTAMEPYPVLCGPPNMGRATNRNVNGGASAILALGGAASAASPVGQVNGRPQKGASLVVGADNFICALSVPGSMERRKVAGQSCLEC